jgi:hypothetical protein
MPARVDVCQRRVLKAPPLKAFVRPAHFSFRPLSCRRDRLLLRPCVVSASANRPWCGPAGATAGRAENPFGSVGMGMARAC